MKFRKKINIYADGVDLKDLKKINQNHKPNEGYMKSLKNDDEFTRNLN